MKRAWESPLETEERVPYIVYKLFCCRELLILQYGMEGSSNKYILLVDCVGHTLLRDLQAEPGLFTKATRTHVLRGELVEALPEAEQPSDFHRIALVGIERKSLHLQCPTADLTRLSDEDANLLLGISSTETRYQTFIDKKRLDFGQRLSPGDLVFVSVKGSGQDLPGVVRYKGALPPWRGAVFGVELTVGINPSIKGFMYFSAILLG